jgi:acylphosphatase
VKIRKKLVFYGEVQGVGFRYRAYYIAQSLDLAGWVYNRWDGNVEMEVEGEQTAITSLIARLKTAPFLRIDRVEQEEIPVKNESGFRVMD